MKFLNKYKLVILLDQAVFSGTSFLLTLLIARITEVESFGEYSAYMLGIYLLVNTAGAFVIQPFQVLLGKSKNIRAYISFTFWLQIIALMLVMGIVFAAMYFLKPGISFSILPFAAGFILHDFARKILLALNKQLQTLLLDTASSVFLLMGLYFFNQQTEKSIAELMEYFAMAYIPPFLFLTTVLLPFVYDKNLIKECFSLHLKEGKWLFFTAITQWWSGNLFVLASGIYLGAGALGALRLAQSLLGVLNVLLQTFENYVLPQTAFKILSSTESAISYLGDMSQKAALLFLPVLGFTFLFAEQIMVIAGGSEYSEFAYVLRGMSLLYVFIFLGQPIRLIIRALLLNKHFFYAYLISLSFALVFGHPLLSNYGLSGAIMGLIGSQILLMAYWSFVLHKKNIQLWRSYISF
jgi:O-antigen/teichoic acid export membrane protein